MAVLKGHESLAENFKRQKFYSGKGNVGPQPEMNLKITTLSKKIRKFIQASRNRVLYLRIQPIG